MPDWVLPVVVLIVMAVGGYLGCAWLSKQMFREIYRARDEER